MTKAGKIEHFLFALWVAGLCYILFSNFYPIENTSFCIIKNVTGMPCPSCGSTRSVLLLGEGKFLEAFKINPLGYVIVFIMTIIPATFVYGLIKHKNLLSEIFFKAEKLIRKKYIFIGFVVLIFINWIWNFYKGL